jgi:hypothetical protein
MSQSPERREAPRESEREERREEERGEERGIIYIFNYYYFLFCLFNVDNFIIDSRPVDEAGAKLFIANLTYNV